MPPLNSIMIVVVIGVLLVIAVFVVVVLLFTAITYKENPVKDRLLTLKTSHGATFTIQRKREPWEDAKETIIGFSGPIAKNLYGENVKFQKEIKSLLTEAGLPDSDANVWRAMAVQVATALVCGISLTILTFVFTQNTLYAAGAAIAGLLVGRMGAQFSLRAKGKERKEQIRRKLPDALDLMVVCVEAGLGLDATIHRVGDDMEHLAPEIAHEFKRLNRELNAGVLRTDAFQNLGSRAGVDELRNLCSLITQSDKLGTSISDTLRIYSDDMRVRRRQKAEELAAKASTKITFPLVLFIFPPLFIVLLGPSVITAMSQFLTVK